MPKFLTILAAGTACLFLFGCGPSGGPVPVDSGSSDKLIGGGSTFVYPVMSKWTSEFYKKTGKQINYQSLGSGGGVKQFSVNTLDFGATDAPMNESQLKEAGGTVLHIPVVMGAVAVSYNLPDIKTSLTLSGPVISDIYLEKIRKWNDPEIAALNPGVALPPNDIVTVRRADGSGTTFIFADFLSRTSPNWKAKMGVGNSLQWPGNAIGAKGNEGVSAQIQRTRNSIGYVELVYAMELHISMAAIINADGKAVMPSVESVTAAGDDIKEIPDDLRMSIVNSPGANAYPISGISWVVVREVMRNTGKKEVLTNFLNYVLSEEGQGFEKALNYSRLPKTLLEKSKANVRKISSK